MANEMSKAEMDILEKVFNAETLVSIYQSKSKAAKKLEQDGFIVETAKQFGNPPLTVSCKGYITTLLGNMTYCTSDRCK